MKRGGRRQRPRDLHFGDPEGGSSEGGFAGHGGGAAGGIHPKLLTSLINRCGDLAQLHALVENHCASFNERHIQVSIRKLSHLVETIRFQGNSAPFNTALWVQLFDKAVELADTLSVEDIALSTYAVSTIEGEGAARFMAKLQTRALQIMGEFFDLKSLAKFLYGLAHARTEGIPHGLIEATARRVETLLPKYAGKDKLHWGLQVRPHFRYGRLLYHETV